ncbi:hypothetical protein AV650_02325 [Serratia fonticola]|nr:hypothetical protein AV650_02325 [Serratia fonticola]
MNKIYDNARLQFESQNSSAFSYLRAADQLLSNPVSLHMGRDLVIRALDAREKFSNYTPLLRNLVRKAGLFPYLKKEFQDVTVSENAALSIYQTPFSEKIVFHSTQFQVFELLRSGRNVVLSAPTSMGKSAIVDSIIGLGEVRRIVLVVPTIALADETRRRLQERFGENYQVIHHSSQEATSDRVIFVLTQERVNERQDIIDIDFFVIDEFYKLAFQQRASGKIDYENERVIELNIALSKLLKASKQFYMTGPFINHVNGLASLGLEYTFISSDFNTVALDIESFDIAPKDIESKKKAVISISERCRGQATIIYCKSSGVAGDIARILAGNGFGADFNSSHLDWVASEYDPEWDYCVALRHGIGLHFGGLPRALQQYTIDLFNNGEIDILICTSTIIEGVNTIAKNVVIHDNRDGNFSIDKFTHGNIKGRAGRMGVHYVGTVYCLESIPEDSFNQEVEVPLGIQDETTPMNLLVGVQPEHLSEYSQSRFDKDENVYEFGVELLKRHSSFSLETFRELYAFVEMLSENSMRSAIFHWLPTGEFLNVLATALIRFTPGALHRARIKTGSPAVIHAKLTSYIYTPIYAEYFKTQINQSKGRLSRGEVNNLSTCINDDLKIVINIFGHTVPKLLNVLEDVVKLYAKRHYIEGKVDYSKLRSIFEHYHLSTGLAGMEEMGIPVQTLQRLSRVLSVPEDLDVDKVAQFLRDNHNRWQEMGSVDRAFMERTLYPDAI